MWWLSLAGALALHPHSGIYQARLEQEISVRSTPGERFTAVVIGEVEGEGASLPIGTRIWGKVERTGATGLGLRREKDFLQLSFDGCTLPDGTEVDCSAILRSVDNARESVVRGNRIQGIAAASHPHSVANGIWLRPGLDRLGRAGFGLTGAGGVIDSKFLGHPLASLAFVVPRMVFWRLPNTEIRFPAGTDLMVEVCHPAFEPPNTAIESNSLADLPARIFFPNGKAAEDQINIALLATAEALTNAFHSAGWNSTDELTTQSFKKLYAAFSRMNTYREAPVSPMHYEGRLPDLVFQKSFNTLAKRHHVRFWRREWEGQEIWLGAATHDVAMRIDWTRMNFTHLIDPRIDRERRILRNDLRAAACVSQESLVERPALANLPDQLSPQTDGRLLVLRLKDCGVAIQPETALLKSGHGLLYSCVRRVTLETRNYALRGNPYYYAAKLLKSRREQPDALMLR